MPTVVVLHRARIDAFLSPAGPVGRKLQGYGRKTVTAAKRKAPVDFGILKSSIDMSTRIVRKTTIIRIGTNLKYGLYQEVGTGRYGPEGHDIFPKRRKFLKFEPKATRKAFGPLRQGESRIFVFARSVKGSKPHHYLERALRQSVPWPVRSHRL